MKPPTAALAVERFEVELQKVTDGVPEDLARSLRAHYAELLRWNRRLSLVGPGTLSDAIGRHYAESLLGLELAPERVDRLVDVGSGAGFPGFVLGAARTEARTYLVESREKKCAFLRAAARSSRLSIQCLCEKIADPLPAALPQRIDLLTLRALRLPMSVWRLLTERLTDQGRVLVWMGREAPIAGDHGSTGVASFESAGLRPVAQRELSGSAARRIVALERFQKVDSS